MGSSGILENLTQFVPFTGLLGLELVDVGEGTAEVVLPQRDELLNHVQTQHAGALFTVAETAAAASLFGRLGDRVSELGPVVERADIAYLKPARGRITARGTADISIEEVLETLDRDGRMRCAINSELSDSEGTVVAKATYHFYMRKAK